MTTKTSPQYAIGRKILLASACAGLLVVGCGTWVARAKITAAVMASGQVSVERHLKSIQHRDGGVVKSIRIEDGSHVREGDLLLELDDSETRTELAILSSQLFQSLAKHARLSAEVELADAIRFPGELDATSREVREAEEGEERVFRANASVREGQKEQLRLQISQLDEQVGGLRSQDEAKAEELEIIKGELRHLRDLYAKNLIEVSKVNAIDRDVVRITGERGAIASEMARAVQHRSEISIEILGIDQASRAKAQEEQRSLEAQIVELRERLARAQDRLAHMEMRAPESGIVNELSVHTIGGVITPAQVVLSIVPDSENLMIEANFAATDIDQLAIGQDVRLRFPAFNQRTTPEVSGRIVHLAAAATTDRERGGRWYAAKISIGADRTKLGDKALVPGMPVEVFVSAGERTVLSYLMKPVADQFNRTFREE